jgi:hypothetical protein
MDITICVIDKKEKILKFAGAKNPLVYIKNKQIVRIKGDTFSIGGRREDKLFQKHVINLTSEPTSFYIFSDGYQDQFSSGMRSKFMAKRFRKLLLRLQRYPFSEQRILLEQILSDWMRDTKQIDDILVMGFRL